MAESLQQRYAPHHRCFGCGPANPQGLHIASFPQGAQVVARWRSSPHHEAFPGMLSGGIIGTLLDCHSNWTAAYALMQRSGAATPPCTVTADYHVRLLRPTPTDGEILLSAEVSEAEDDRATVRATLEAGGRTTATCTGLFVAVREGHPAFRRW